MIEIILIILILGIYNLLQFKSDRSISILSKLLKLNIDERTKLSFEYMMEDSYKNKDMFLFKKKYVFVIKSFWFIVLTVKVVSFNYYNDEYFQMNYRNVPYKARIMMYRIIKQTRKHTGSTTNEEELNYFENSLDRCYTRFYNGRNFLR